MPASHFLKGGFQTDTRIYAGVAINVPQWAAGQSYEANDLILTGSDLWVTSLPHVAANSFATDLSNGRWASVAQGLADKNFVHTQASPLSIWVVDHFLGKLPTVATLGFNGKEFIGSIAHVSSQTTHIEFNFPVSGIAILN